MNNFTCVWVGCVGARAAHGGPGAGGEGEGEAVGLVWTWPGCYFHAMYDHCQNITVYNKFQNYL